MINDTDFNDTKKTNEIVFINNNKRNPSYLSSKNKQSEQQTDKIDEIGNIFYSDTEKKEEKPKQQFFIDKGLEEQMCKCYYTQKYWIWFLKTKAKYKISYGFS